MIVALGNLALVAAFNWPPLTVLIDRALHWPNISVGLSQVALVGCAAGSCVMITSVASPHSPGPPAGSRCSSTWWQPSSRATTLVLFFRAGWQPEMSPQEYLGRNSASSSSLLPWLLRCSTCCSHSP